ncbi:PTS sugar transporter subunit IIB, partial [Enterococcus faecalis]|uniref:PTS sugar transporter subunit IIB n=1 Tax=Enterococcus faecalis TaxID=1351 RepID=UPI003CC50F23
KTVSVIFDLVIHGVPIKELNIGCIAQKNPEKDLLVTKTVYLNKEDAEKLKELHEEYGLEDIYFQATPTPPKTSLKDHKP